ncbi:medium-chain fatty-acid--CoA ligase [Eggerthella lenta]|uniref:medium-chain fatty-acid--CoA ligase n=1 Tax=Eggerthella lenta TaxID=84112 RepID=UPI0018981D7D|nr:medium-chain fatty-acid--CoA ligase [Eggerthella lenta]
MITDLKINAERKQFYYEKGHWTEKTLGDVWADRVASHPERTYVSDDQGSSYTYGEIDDKAARLAAWLVEQGVAPGDVVTFQMPTWAEFCIVYVAALKAGAVMHPLPRNFNDADLVYGMNLVGSRAFICPTKVAKVDFESQILSIVDQIPTLGPVALVDKAAPKHSELPTVAEICARYEPIEYPPPITSDDVACILSTSGTTGKPKAVLFTHNNLIFSERSFVKGTERTADDVMFMASPLNHATGFFHGLISPMILGGRTVLQQDFRPAQAIEQMNREGCTWSMGATPFIYDMLKCIEFEDGPRFETLQLFLCGGAPVPGNLVQCAHGHGVMLAEIYGSTESCPHIFVPPAKCLEWNGAWSGIPFPGIEVRIVDGDRNDVPRGEQGEEISRGPHQFVGYLNAKERTDRALDDDGWFYSGDLGYMDEEGRIRINGRKKEIIIRGGENICAREIDDDLMGCPGVGETATIGMPDERLGERICTFAVPVDERRPTVEDVTAYLAEKHVAKRLWPERMEYIDEIPKTATGKVKRFELAKELAKRMENE